MYHFARINLKTQFIPSTMSLQLLLTIWVSLVFPFPVVNINRCITTVAQSLPIPIQTDFYGNACVHIYIFFNELIYFYFKKIQKVFSEISGSFGLSGYKFRKALPAEP